jgi:hypothetical protein
MGVEIGSKNVPVGSDGMPVGAEANETASYVVVTVAVYTVPDLSLSVQCR